MNPLKHEHPSSVFTLLHNGQPAQLVGFVKSPTTGEALAVIRLKGGGVFLEIVHPSRLTPMHLSDLRPPASPTNESNRPPLTSAFITDIHEPEGEKN